MQKQHATLHDQFSRVKMLQMGACFVWKENPGGSNPFFMNVGPGISADIGARIILAPSFGISLEDMKTKIKGKVPQPAYQSNLFGPPTGCQGFLGLHPIWFDADWIYLIILNSGNNDETNPLLFSGRCTKNISRPKFLRICGSQLLSMADAQEIRMWHDVTQLIGISNSCLPIRRLEVPPSHVPSHVQIREWFRVLFTRKMIGKSSMWPIMRAHGPILSRIADSHLFRHVSWAAGHHFRQVWVADWWRHWALRKHPRARIYTRSYILLELSALAIANSGILFALNFLPPAWFSRTMAKRSPLKQPIHLPKMTSPRSDDLWRHKTSLGWEAPVPSNSNGL